MTALSVALADVRDFTQDDDSAAYRVSDSTYITYANRFSRVMCHLRPDLFATIGDITCTAATVVQSAPAAAVKLIDIFQIKDGRVVTETDRASMDRYNNGWMTDTAGPAQNWIRQEKNPAKFFIYPKSPNPQTLVGEWSVLPTAYSAVGDAISLSDAYIPAMTAFLSWCALSRFEDGVNRARAAEQFQLFLQIIGVTKMGKAELDAKEDIVGKLA